jgi:hypothetical protein
MPSYFAVIVTLSQASLQFTVRHEVSRTKDPIGRVRHAKARSSEKGTLIPDRTPQKCSIPERVSGRNRCFRQILLRVAIRCGRAADALTMPPPKRNRNQPYRRHDDQAAPENRLVPNIVWRVRTVRLPRCFATTYTSASLGPDNSLSALRANQMAYITHGFS